ncbi:MAG: flagellar hook-basal body complex protein FliE [Acidobacteria bacterium]|nr:flagellar hook-basal body complex protein FliE [Acidobacteriota bacterium]
MPSPIPPIRPPVPAIPEIQPSSQNVPGGGFGAVFRDAVQGVERLGSDASEGIQRFLSGEGGELHTVALDTQRAQLAFELFLQVRNKVVEAYQEVMRSQI